VSDVVICDPVRTPVGAFGGVFARPSATDLATPALRSLVSRTGLGEGDVDDVILGQCSPSGEAPAIGRVAALDAGLGTSVPGLQIDRRCGSGLQAVLQAAMQVGSGGSRLVIGGGVESMSQAEHYALGLRAGVRGDGVELMDRLARARVTASGRSHPVPGGMIEGLAALRPVRLGVDSDATVTAGNASGQNDGAAMCVVTTRDAAERLGLRPMVRLVSWAVAGVDPAEMGIGPVPATATALERAGLTLDDMDLIELNEAFAAQVIAVMREWGIASDDRSRVNVSGSGIALGHPVGATGARILATLAHEMHRRDAHYGLETMCIGGGQGLAAIFEAVR